MPILNQGLKRLVQAELDAKSLQPQANEQVLSNVESEALRKALQDAESERDRAKQQLSRSSTSPPLYPS